MDVLIPIIGLLFSATLYWVSLWQIEVSWWCDETFEFPFFALVINKYWARDFWYLVNVIGWVIGIISGYELAVMMV